MNPVTTHWQGSPQSTTYTATIPGSFCSSLATQILNLPNGTAKTVWESITLHLAGSATETISFSISPGELFVLADIWQKYQSGLIGTQTWSIYYTNSMSLRRRIDFTTTDLIALFSVIDYAIAGGTPGSLDGDITITNLDDNVMSPSNGGPSSPVGVYD